MLKQIEMHVSPPFSSSKAVFPNHRAADRYRSVGALLPGWTERMNRGLECFILKKEQIYPSPNTSVTKHVFPNINKQATLS